MTSTNQTEAQMKLAREYACQAVEVYGEGDAREHDAAVLRTLWNDHPAVQSALLAIQATEARAQGLVELLEMVDSIEYKELNLSNYTHDDVCALNNVYVEMQLILTQALATWRRT